jgi:hypothetical protein
MVLKKFKKYILNIHLFKKIKKSTIIANDDQRIFFEKNILPPFPEGIFEKKIDYCPPRLMAISYYTD